MTNNVFRFRLKFLLEKLDLTSEAFIIGRSPLCNLPIEDPLVSRQHACITVRDDFAVLDDLGSRNGTLVNGQPVFDDYRLNHSDCIRVGSNELIFIKEQIQIQTKYSHDSETVECPRCGTLLPINNSVCSGCGSVFIPDYICLNCHLPVRKEDRSCKRCGATIDNDDSTIPVELGGRESGWNSKLTDDVIETALSVQRYQQAARLLGDKIQEFEKNKEFDKEVLVKISQFNLALAKEFKDPGRMTWIVEQFRCRVLPMPDSLLRNFEDAALGWYDMKQDIQGYIDAIESLSSRPNNHGRFLQRLYELIMQGDDEISD